MLGFLASDENGRRQKDPLFRPTSASDRRASALRVLVTARTLQMALARWKGDVIDVGLPPTVSRSHSVLSAQAAEYQRQKKIGGSATSHIPFHVVRIVMVCKC